MFRHRTEEQIRELFSIENKKINDLWEQYDPLLSQYYDTNTFINDTRSKDIEIDKKVGHDGATKVSFILTGNSGKKYAQLVTMNRSSISVIANELTVYFPILLKFLQLQSERQYKFNIPRLYKNNESSANNYYFVVDAVNFSDEQLRPAKYLKYSVLLDQCMAQGQFIDFMLYEVNLYPHDYESYIDDDTQVLNFVDFSGCHEASLDKIESFLNTLEIEVYASVSHNNHLSWTDSLSAEQEASISEGANCIMSQIRGHN